MRSLIIPRVVSGRLIAEETNRISNQPSDILRKEVIDPVKILPELIKRCQLIFA